jgi:YkoY family integral membrane protein
MSLTIEEWVAVMSTIATVVALEGLLGVDNALILAMMVRHLPRRRRKRALRYGMLGAFGFRFIAVLLATGLQGFWPFEVGGGGYLLCLSTSRLVGGRRGSDRRMQSRAQSGLWGTIVRVELTDLAFSIDSILAAVGIAGGLPRRLHVTGFGGLTIEQWVIISGGMLGIVAMRFAAGGFLALLDRFRSLGVCAYVLVAWVGVKLIGEGLHHALDRGEGLPPGGWLGIIPDSIGRNLEMPGWLFWAGMALIVVTCLLFKPTAGDGNAVGTGASNRPGGE